MYTQDKLLANEPQNYICSCGTIMSEETVGVRIVDCKGNKKLYCTMCQNEDIKLII